MSAFLAHAPIAWYVARASGLVAFGILTLSVWLGLATSTRVLGPRRQKHVVGWHQTLAWTGLSAIALHAVSLLFDPTLHFGLSSVLVPFASAWRPGAVAAGVVAGWLTLTLATSFRMRKRIGQKGWRRLHYASFAAFLLTVGHALTAGTDLRGISGLLLGGIAMAPVVWLGLFRILAPRTPARPAATPGAAPA
jgi:sulfoxide reductase heme-binding subunit YedZ